MELLGDPVTLVSGMGHGVFSFFRKTGADLLGESETTGEGLKDLLQGVVGGAFGSVAKITGAADDLLSKVSGSHGMDSAAGLGFASASASGGKGSGSGGGDIGGSSSSGRDGSRQGAHSLSHRQQRPTHVGEGLAQVVVIGYGLLSYFVSL